jgi:hypothetical protein
MPTLRERLRLIAAQLHTCDYREPLYEGVAQVLEAIKTGYENGANGENEEEEYEDEEDSENVDNN